VGFPTHGGRDTPIIIPDGPFSPTSESLKAYRIPQWYQDAKFGIFIHWGLYSVPAFGSEWYAREMYKRDTREYAFHCAVYGELSTFGYKDFIPLFKGERFDPAAWADPFADAGARFVVPVAEHHDGFAMYDMALNPWNAVKMGPRRDIIAELSVATRERGMIFGISSHRAEHWWFFDEGMKYYLPKLAAYYYNRAAQWNKEVALNYKHDAFEEGTAVLDIERGQLKGIRPQLWQNDTSVSRNS
jgi:alpha-L-fucosidase